MKWRYRTAQGFYEALGYVTNGSALKGRPMWVGGYTFDGIRCRSQGAGYPNHVHQNTRWRRAFGRPFRAILLGPDPGLKPSRLFCSAISWRFTQFSKTPVLHHSIPFSFFFRCLRLLPATSFLLPPKLSYAEPETNGCRTQRAPRIDRG